MFADILSHLQYLYRYSAAEITRRSSVLGSDCALGPTFLANLRNRGAIPSLRHIYAIGEIFHLTLGSAFSVFGIDLDALIREEARINRDRTRLIESYVFNRNCPIWIPAVVSPTFGQDQTSYLRELVPEWRQVPVYTVAGAGWQNRDILYGRLGANDTNAAPDIPAGAGIQIRRLRKDALSRLGRDAYYFVQHPWGYMVCRCEYRSGILTLLSSDPSYPGPHRLRYGQEVIILGEVIAYCAALPTAPYRYAAPLPRSEHLPHAIAPWNHSSFPDLFATERLRTRINAEVVDQASTQLAPLVGHHVSGRYALGPDLPRHTPHTSTALTLSIAASVRLTDMFRSCRIAINDAGKYQLGELLSIDDRSALPELLPPASTPVPQSAWDRYILRAGEWPMPLSEFLSRLGDSHYEILQVDQSRRFRGLDHLLRPGSYLAIQPPTHRLADDVSAQSARDWARPLYVVERIAPTPLYYCGYLSQTAQGLSLLPHPSSDDHTPMTFPKNEARVVGRVAGVASRVA